MLPPAIEYEEGRFQAKLTFESNPFVDAIIRIGEIEEARSHRIEQGHKSTGQMAFPEKADTAGNRPADNIYVVCQRHSECVRRRPDSDRLSCGFCEAGIGNDILESGHCLAERGLIWRRRDLFILRIWPGAERK